MENPSPLGHLCKAICSQCCRELKPLIGNAFPCCQTHSTRSLCLSALVAPIQSFLQPAHRSHAESQGGDESGLAGDRPFRFRSPDKLTWGGHNLSGMSVGLILDVHRRALRLQTKGLSPLARGTALHHYPKTTKPTS